MTFYPFSVKIMLKMHQKPFGGRAPPGLAGGSLIAPPDLLAAIWGLRLRGKGGKGREI